MIDINEESRLSDPIKALAETINQNSNDIFMIAT